MQLGWIPPSPWFPPKHGRARRARRVRREATRPGATSDRRGETPPTHRAPDRRTDGATGGHSRPLLVGLPRSGPPRGPDRRRRDRAHVEAVTHHAGDAPDLMMDDGVRAIWDASPRLTGPGRTPDDRADLRRGRPAGRHVDGRDARDAPAPPYGSNCAANWGLCTTRSARSGSRSTSWSTAAGEFPATARTAFGFDFATLDLYSVPGVIAPPDLARAPAVLAARRRAGAPAPGRDRGRARRGRSTQQHPARRVGRQRRQLAVRPERRDPLPGVPRRRRLLRRRSALRPRRR